MDEMEPNSKMDFSDIENMQMDLTSEPVGGNADDPVSHYAERRVNIFDAGGEPISCTMLLKAQGIADITLGGHHPFKVSLTQRPNKTWFATMVKGFIMDADLSFEEPNVVTHNGNEPVETDVNADEYLVIVQTIDGSGDSDYQLSVVVDTADLISVSGSKYYADWTQHLIAKIIEDPDSTASPKPLIVEYQYMTNNVVRAISTHSGVAYYRLLPI